MEIFPGFGIPKVFFLLFSAVRENQEKEGILEGIGIAHHRNGFESPSETEPGTRTILLSTLHCFF